MDDIPRNCYVYSLKHKEAKEEHKVFYIGRSSIGSMAHRYKDADKAFNKRLVEHLWYARTGSTKPVHKKIREIIQTRGEHIYLDVVAKNLSLLEAQDLEKRLIECIGLDNLTNVSPGGDDFAWLVKTPFPIVRKQGPRTAEQREHYREGSRKRAVKAVSVTGEVFHFESTQEASRVLGLGQKRMARDIRRNYTTKGYKIYYDDNADPVPDCLKYLAKAKTPHVLPEFFL